MGNIVWRSKVSGLRAQRIYVGALVVWEERKWLLAFLFKSGESGRDNAVLLF